MRWTKGTGLPLLLALLGTCVTVDESISGTLASPSALRLIATSNPGPANPNPPAGAVPAAGILDLPADQGDVALVLLNNVDWSSIANNRLGIWPGSAEAMVGRGFTAYGYGINVAAANCGTDVNTSGAGIARSGAVFTIASGTHFFDGQPFNNPSTGGQSIFCGDSGGPDEMNVHGYQVLLGVHTTGANISAPATGVPFNVTLQGS